MDEREQLKRRVALEVMGQTWDGALCRVCGYPVNETVADGCTTNSCSVRPPPQYRADSVFPDYTGNMNSIWLLEEEIERRGQSVMKSYVECLAIITEAAYMFNRERPQDDWQAWWALVRATPEQRCRAALEAVKQCQR